ncbi:hypothetical protein POM88_010790 [Heracleum sosnowskyi]|uniref:non-specific serine/threonine protein kinase n=1 Tax=Heracleum sosnowskyi TaxID=360622 RepID=A0AAD8ITA9_9APIA|nr:hypothetical protein POM88_010790 [Heracleum sosnowskyi]
MAASELPAPPSAKNGRSRLWWMIIPILLMTVIVVGLCLWVVRKRRKKHTEGIRRLYAENDGGSGNRDDDLELPLFDFITLDNATNGFSIDSKLGEGGFGPVYKGILDKRNEIAVKRLSKDSTQGPKEFKNEVSCIAQLQHRNLVKLLGCSVQKGERLLVYEYMHNKSLDLFIFDTNQSKTLDWPMRSVERLKLEPITTRVVGTYGYMSPEYALDGIFSVKSDVYSFGVLQVWFQSVIATKDFIYFVYYLPFITTQLTLKWALVLSSAASAKDFHSDKIEESQSLGGKFTEHSSLHLLRNRCFSFVVLSDCTGLHQSRCWHTNLRANPWFQVSMRSFFTCCLHSYKHIPTDKSRITDVENLIVAPISKASARQRAGRAGRAWRTYAHGKVFDLVDKYPEDRPTMATVVLMLTSENALPEPTRPGFFTERKLQQGDSSTSSSNYLSITAMAPR